MDKVGIFYGSTTGKTQEVAEKIAAYLDDADVTDIGDASLEDLQAYDTLILGSSTWGVGDLQDDWETVLGDLTALDLSGKQVAFFGMGSQDMYPGTFVDAIGILYDALKNSNAQFIGTWPTDGYGHLESRAERDGAFIGLALDDDSTPDLTDQRIRGWVAKLKTEIED